MILRLLVSAVAMVLALNALGVAIDRVTTGHYRASVGWVTTFFVLVLFPVVTIADLSGSLP